MEESVTYQAIIQRGMERGLRTGRAEGRTDGLRESILAQGEEKFGAPTAEQAAALAAIADADRLHAMSKKLLRANTWGELLAD